jgi:hypothetical protein
MRAISPRTLRDARVLHLTIVLVRLAGALVASVGFWLSCPASAPRYETPGLILIGIFLGYTTGGNLGLGAGHFFTALPIGMRITARNCLIAGIGQTLGVIVGAIAGRLIAGPFGMVIGSGLLRWGAALLALRLMADRLPVSGVKLHLKGKHAEYFILDILGSPAEQQSTVYVATTVPYESSYTQECVLKTFADSSVIQEEAHIWINFGIHRFIVTALRVDIINGHLYIVLEHVKPDKQGRASLADYLVAPLALSTCMRWAMEICIAMEYAFRERGLIAHGDIKPSNILITADHHVKVTDFGLSLANANGLTQQHPAPRAPAFPGDRTDGMVGRPVGGAGGTVPWMAPEQFLGIANGARI